jgi:hypothetical protein
MKPLQEDTPEWWRTSGDRLTGGTVMNKKFLAPVLLLDTASVDLIDAQSVRTTKGGVSIYLNKKDNWLTS